LWTGIIDKTPYKVNTFWPKYVNFQQFKKQWRNVGFSHSFHTSNGLK